LSVGKETAVIALPGVVKNLGSESLVNNLLVSVRTLFGVFDSDIVLINLELVVGPKTVVECVRLFLSSSRIYDDGGGPSLDNCELSWIDLPSLCSNLSSASFLGRCKDAPALQL